MLTLVPEEALSFCLEDWERCFLTLPYSFLSIFSYFLAPVQSRVGISDTNKSREKRGPQEPISL